MKIDITIIGGDTRFAYAKEYFEQYFNLTHAHNSDLQQRLKTTDYVLLPIPYCRNGNIVGTTFSKSWLANLRDSINPSTVIFAGKVDRFFNQYLFDFNKYDYLNDAEFINKNAKLTVDGTIANLEKKHLLKGCEKILIIGWGRIGKGLCQKLLRKEIPHVSILSTTVSKKMQIEKSGAHFFDSTNSISSYNLVINTAPAQVLKQSDLALMMSNQTIIELASGEGGFPQKYRQMFQLNVTDYMGIPGKQYPKEAGRILGSTIIEQIEEINEEIIEGGTVEWILNS